MPMVMMARMAPNSGQSNLRAQLAERGDGHQSFAAVSGSGSGAPCFFTFFGS